MKDVLNIYRYVFPYLDTLKSDERCISPEIHGIQVALEDLVLGAPGSPAAVDVGDLIIVTGVGNNSPGAFMAGVYDMMNIPSGND